MLMIETSGQWVKKDASGRKIIKTNIQLVGNINDDLDNIKKILKDALGIHKDNVLEMDVLYSIFFGHTSIQNKSKSQRDDINNKVAVNSALPIVRTINSYCFGEAFKYLATNVEKQRDIEIFNESMN